MLVAQTDAGARLEHLMMATSDNLIELTATDAIALMQRGDLAAETYARALLARAKQCADLNAFRTFEPDRVLEAARAADKARNAGGALGAMHGLPIAVKDSVNTADYPTSNGTRALRDFRPRADADVLKPLKAAGAIVMGKTNLHELSFGWTSNNECFGSVHNPHDRTRIPGGSSGGSAAAVAASIAPLAIAEDTLGSIRVPASCCGLAGLRPTFGRYSDNGIMSLTSDKFDQVGPIARAVADLILFDSVVSGEVSPAPATPLQGVRIGLADHFLAGLDPAVERVVGAAFAKLRDAGAVLVDVKMPEIVRAAPEIAFTIIACEAADSIEAFLKEQQTGLTLETMLAQAGPSIRTLVTTMASPGNRPPREAYQAMLAKREQLKTTLRDWYRAENIVALAHPVILCPPSKIGLETEVEVGGQKVPIRAAFGRNIALGSCASLASLVLPAGVTPDGLPIGLEFDALSGQDRALLSLGLSLEAVLGRGKAAGI
jgi:mandelamide amidase